jgi:hypothetical protein
VGAWSCRESYIDIMKGGLSKASVEAQRRAVQGCGRSTQSKHDRAIEVARGDALLQSRRRWRPKRGAFKCK